MGLDMVRMWIQTLLADPHLRERDGTRNQKSRDVRWVLEKSKNKRCPRRSKRLAFKADFHPHGLSCDSLTTFRVGGGGRGSVMSFMTLKLASSRPIGIDFDNERGNALDIKKDQNQAPLHSQH